MLSYSAISEVDSLNMCVDHKSIHWARHVVSGQLSSLLEGIKALTTLKHVKVWKIF